MEYIYGINPVSEALRSESGCFAKIYIADGRKGEPVRNIVAQAKEQSIPVEFTDRTYLDRCAGGSSHQGVVGLCESFAYADVEDLILTDAGAKGELILLLDQIVDPQNLGSLIRTANCCGAKGVIIPENRAAPVTATVMKASAGALRHTPVARVINMARTIECLKENGYWIYGAEAAVGQDIRSVNYDRRIGLVMGSEGKGMRPSIKKQCDFLLSIPMNGEIGSLNVAVAAGIIMYEIGRCWGCCMNE
ncbi:MAG: 23S rRNA (guanosine(2251)-2'-O)-methyltransferase RlmB [Deltaproteobacteria bacterium]|nr:23S rRNA (guanosine(2251)-2'-O)-methyltransferase RlmB [Deltaproteobacteria bacterium]